MAIVNFCWLLQDFLKSLNVNEEASRALREAPQEVQRMMLQEVQDWLRGSVGDHQCPPWTLWRSLYKQKCVVYSLEF